MSQQNDLSLRHQDVSVLYAEEEHIRPGAQSGPSLRSIYIIECCTKGKGSVIIDGKEFPFQAGDAYALLPGHATTHTSDVQEPRSGFWCVLDGVFVGNVLARAGITSDNPFFPSVLFPAIRQWLQMMAEFWPCKDAGAQLRQTACAYGLLGAVLQNRPAPDNTSLVDKAIGYIQANYYENLCVDKISEQIGLERTYFSTLFRKKTGQSPHQYLTQFRIRKACQLLDTGKHTVSEAAYMVGLTPHNFSRQFKKELNLTAQEYLLMVQSGTLPNGTVLPRFSRDAK